MARINIEDSLYKDGRFMKLCLKLQSVETALGALIRVWTIAQDCYLQDDRKIPRSTWDKQDLNDEVINCGLAVEENGRIEIVGADEQFSWLVQKIEAGKKGGVKSGEAKRSVALAKQSVAIAGDSGANPLTLTPPLTHSSSTTTESSEIPSDILIAIKTTMQYPDEIIEDIRKDAWIKYLAKEDPEKNWKRFISHYIVNEKETIRNLAIDRGKVVKKPTQNNQARDMATKIWTQVLRNGMHGLRETLGNLTPLETLALDKFGLASEIINCPSDFQATEIKNRLKAACDEAIKLRSGEVDISFQGEQGNNLSKVGG